MGVAIGVDSHKSSLAVAVLDELGRVIGCEEFSNDDRGHRALLEWIKVHDIERVIGIEGTGNFGAALARRLIEANEDTRSLRSCPIGSKAESLPREAGPPRCGRDRPSCRTRRTPLVASTCRHPATATTYWPYESHPDPADFVKSVGLLLVPACLGRLRDPKSADDPKQQDDDTKAYVARRQVGGKSDKEAMRYLKRHLSNGFPRCGLLSLSIALSHKVSTKPGQLQGSSTGARL